MTSGRLSILYRGPLASCNYDCAYCPFAKHRSPPEELRADEDALCRFVSWVRTASHRIAILFTPWGEALVRPWYRDALVALSHMPHVERVAIQTNLSAPLAFTDEADKRRLAFWTTYHPTEVERPRFVERCLELHRRGVRFSVGIVGTREQIDEVRALRAELPAEIYVWINAYKSAGPDYYRTHEIEALAAIDSHFPVNNVRHPSLGRSCRTGAEVISVDGDGDIRRCHFVDEVLGNLYRDDLRDVLRERPCPNETCGCFIGYVHLDALGLGTVFRGGVLERVRSGTERVLR